jgi:single-strand DNA-binding protein
VEGKIQYRKFTGQDGQERYMTDIVASMFRLLGPREGSGTDSRFPGADSMPAAKTANMPTTTSEPATVVEGGDDLPF